MRPRLLHAIGVMLALVLSRHGGAVELPFTGTLSLHVFANPAFPFFQVQGSGVADGAVSPAGVVTGVDFPGLEFAATQAIPITDPQAFPIVELQAVWSNAPGSFLSRPAGFGGGMPLRGTAKVCLFAACGEPPNAFVEIPLSLVGVYTTGTVRGGGLLVTVSGAPWTTGRIDLAQQLHFTGSRQDDSLNLVTPIFISTNIAASAVVPSYARLELNFTVAPEGNCNNGLDDDGDGFADFPADPGCDTAEDASERAVGAACDDGIDNDGDFRVDAFDPGCDGPLDASERSATLVCDDGLDNDEDLLIDFPADPGCVSSVDTLERGNGPCEDGLDNDGDTFIDFPADPGCTDYFDASERGPGFVCDDGIDNDGDFVADYPADAGCTSFTDPSERSESRVCDDGRDQDQDGRIDFPSDPGCASTADTSEREATLACDDGLDNDFDGTKDFPRDPGCSQPADTSEQSTSLACDNALDDDGDGLIDSQQDPGCETPGDPREIYDFDDTQAHRIDGAHPSPDRSIGVAGPTSVSLWTGGAIEGDVEVIGVFSYFAFEGGSVGGDLVLEDDGFIAIRGGDLEGQIDARDTSLVEIWGSGFDLPFGDVLASSGTIAGTLLDGRAVSIPFTRAAGATIRLVPEPGAAIATLAAIAALLAVRATRS